jgi:3-phosphoglycerate kinase
VDKLVLGGGMVFTFLKARGIKVGNSMVEDDQLELAKKLEVIAKEKGIYICICLYRYDSVYIIAHVSIIIHVYDIHRGAVDSCLRCSYS